MTTNEITYEVAPTHDAARAREPFLRRIWPAAAIILGLGLSVVWTCFLGFEIARLIVTVI